MILSFAFAKQFCSSVEERNSFAVQLKKENGKEKENQYWKKGKEEDRMAKRKKPSVGRKEENRLSDLPDAVLFHIMEFLPIREAVQS